MTLEEKIQAIKEKTIALLHQAQRDYDIEFWPCRVEVLFDLRGRSAGQAAWSYGFEHRKLTNVRIRYNVQAIEKDFEHVYNETVPHEVAHLVTYDEKSHGREWQIVCRDLGGKAERCHSIKLEKARNVREWLYRLDSGTELKLKTGRHNKIMKGSRYRTRSGEVITATHFVSQA